MRIILACTLFFAACGAVYGTTRESEYRARSYVIQVPTAFAGERGVAIARREGILRRAVALSGVSGLSAAWLRDHSEVETTSRLDLSFLVRSPSREDAMALATGYAKAYRRAIPEATGLPVRGSGAHDAARAPGVVAFGLGGAFAGVLAGLALFFILDGLRRGSARAPRRASGACAPR